MRFLVFTGRRCIMEGVSATTPAARDEFGMTSQAEQLFEPLRPELYRTNAFRLARLPAHADARELTRRLERIKMLAKLGNATESARGPLALVPPPDLDAMRTAVERLRDPEARFVDEFFWFWPVALTPDAPDAALAALDRGDVATARRLWQEPAAGSVAQHNLAVLAHLLALDFEHRALAAGRPLESLAARLRDQSWADAWKHWKAVLADDAFWERLRGRLTELAEPQLPLSLADNVRDVLPATLLRLNAELAVRWAERRLPPEAQRHKEWVQRSGLDPGTIDDALRRALRPVRERLKSLCATAGEEASGNWQTAVDLFRAVAPLPARESDRDNLLDDVEPALSRICWFCQRQVSAAGSAAVVPMHGRLTRTRTGSGESVHWDRQVIEVPRCWPCSQAHQRWDMLKALGTLPPGVRPESDKDSYPFVTRYLAGGWGLGVAPADF
jgi:hypothetical protein